jgi:hypothetical protein
MARTVSGITGTAHRTFAKVTRMTTKTALINTAIIGTVKRETTMF